MSSDEHSRNVLTLDSIRRSRKEAEEALKKSECELMLGGMPVSQVKAVVASTFVYKELMKLVEEAKSKQSVAALGMVSVFPVDEMKERDMLVFNSIDECNKFLEALDLARKNGRAAAEGYVAAVMQIAKSLRAKET